MLKSNSIVKDAKSYVEQFGYEAVQAIQNQNITIPTRTSKLRSIKTNKDDYHYSRPIKK
ncbi:MULTISPECIES: hypothetical protein [unclassified Rickettsia]|uniref:hypothetical protein n=1 Tax=unclassified Rickettsia TaxID=114295 RepID=UPI003132D0D9